MRLRSSTVCRSLACLLAVVSAGVGVGCRPVPTECAPTGLVAHRDLRYAASPGTDPSLQSLDLYTPVRPAACGPAPLVVYVHGGGFVIGDKANSIAQKVDLFTGEGWAFASVNYRLVGHPGAGPTGGVYPTAEQDVAAAVAYLQGAAAERHRLDPTATMLLGHSSGAFLVALDSTDGSFLAGAGRGLDDIACTAPLDTTYDIAAQIARGGTEEQMFRNAFGDDPAVWRRASPVYAVRPDVGTPAVHIVTRGTSARVDQSQAFGSALRSVGVEASVQVVSGLSHAEVNDAVGQAGETVVTPPLLAFYRDCVADAGAS